MTVDALTDLNRTAWLTAWSHTECGRHWDLERPVSDWLISRLGPPPFAAEINAFTRQGIAARAAWIDARIAAFLAAKRQADVEVWSLGAGFDSRWHTLLSGDYPQISHYREFDFDAVLDAKTALLAESPWADLWAKVEPHAGDLVAGLPDSLPATNRQVLVVIEGLIDYLDQGEKRALLRALRQRVPRGSLLLDAQNGHLLRKSNKRLRRLTGSEAARFAWAPERPNRFYGEESGYRVAASHALLPELLRRRWPITAWLPLPRRLREGYSLFCLQPREEAA